MRALSSEEFDVLEPGDLSPITTQVKAQLPSSVDGFGVSISAE
jgi:hypothetical protein